MKCHWLHLFLISAVSSSSVSSVFSDVLSQPRNSKGESPVLLLISEKALKEDRSPGFHSLEKSTRNERLPSKLSSLIKSLQSSIIEKPDLPSQLSQRKEKPSKLSSLLNRLQPHILHSGLNQLDLPPHSTRNNKLPPRLISILNGLPEESGDREDSEESSSNRVNRLKSQKLSSILHRLDKDESASDESDTSYRNWPKSYIHSSKLDRNDQWSLKEYRDSAESDSSNRLNRYISHKNYNRLDRLDKGYKEDIDESDLSSKLKQVKQHKNLNRDRLDRWGAKARDRDDYSSPRLYKYKPHKSSLTLDKLAIWTPSEDKDSNESGLSNKINKKPHKYSNRYQYYTRDRDSDKSDESNRLYKPKTYKYSNRDKLEQVPRYKDSDESSNRLYAPKTYKYSDRDTLDKLISRGDKHDGDTELSPTYRDREDSDEQDLWRLLSWLENRNPSSHYHGHPERDQEIYVYSPRQQQEPHKSRYPVKTLLRLRDDYSCKVQTRCKKECDDNYSGDQEDDCAESCEAKYDCSPKNEVKKDSCEIDYGSCGEDNVSTRALSVTDDKK